MDSQVKRIEALKSENIRLKEEIKNLKEKPPESPENIVNESLIRLKQEILLALRTLDKFSPKLQDVVQLPENDYYLELARLHAKEHTAASFSNIMDEKEVDSMIAYIGGIDEV